MMQAGYWAHFGRRLRWLFGFAALFAGLGMSGLAAAQNPFAGVVSILPVWPDRLTPQLARQKQEQPEGSGVVFARQGWIATAAHVVAPATEIFVRLGDGRILPTQNLAFDKRSDIAVLQVAVDLPILPFAAESREGTPVCAVGNPFGLGLSISCGVISGRHRTAVGFNAIEDFVQTDAAVNPGMSGGALINQKGQLVGMLSAIFTKAGDGDIGVNFAVSTALLRRVIAPLQHSGRVQWGQPGMDFAPLKRPAQRLVAGARVRHVQETGAAAAAGLQVGDIITRAGARTVRRARDVLTALQLVPHSQAVPLHVRRGEQTLRLSITLK